MNKKGFTLIELMAVLIILSIILVITVPKIMKYVSDSKEKAYQTQVQTIENAAKTFAINGNILLPDEGETVYITVQDLISTGTLNSKEIINPKTSEKMNGYVLISYNKSYEQYEYVYVDEVAQNLTSALGPVYEVSKEEKWATSKNVTISFPEGYPSYEYKVLTGKIKIGTQEIEGESDWIASNELKVNLVFLTEGSLIARVQSNNEYKNGKILEVKYIDTTEPSITLTKTVSDNNVTLNVVCTDAESGIVKYEFKKANDSWINNETNNTYTFSNLDESQEYIFTSRCTNAAGITAVQEID